MKWTKSIPVGYNFKLAISATKESIEKRWKPKARGKVGAECKLCDLYFEGGEANCQFCPVSFKTNRQYCNETPYQSWKQAYMVNDSFAHLLLAKEEVKFLEKLMADLKDEWALRKAKGKVKK